MQSLPMEVGSSSSSSSSAAPRDPSGPVLQVCFPSARASVLDGLNRQREDGRLCDLSIHVQGRVFRAHRCVLAASSPYFHDQVLLKDMSSVSIPAAMDPLAFEGVLSCAYTGELRMLREDVVNYLTVGSVLQMWDIVDKCTELLKEGRAGAAGGASGGAGVRGGGRSAHPGCSSSHSDGGRGQVVGSNEPQQAPQPPRRPPPSESQSPSSTNYFSPRDGAGAAAAGAAGDGGGGGGARDTPSYCTPSGGEEAFLHRGGGEGEEEELMYHQRKAGRGGGGGGRRRKKSISASEQEVGVSDRFGVSSYQDGDGSAMAPRRRPAYSQPSIVPRKQWVVVKAERVEDDDLLVVSGEEGGEDEEEEEEEEEEEDDDERETALERERERSDFNISNVRSLSAELGGGAEADLDSQVDYCRSPEDYLKFEGSLMDPTVGQHQNPSAGRAVSALLGQVQHAAAAARTQLLPLDMQGNQILLYSQAPGLSLDPAVPPPGGAGLEHGAVHLSVQSALGADCMDGGGGVGVGGGGGGGSGRLFMCHCGKTFTHKSMRDRHVNMHLDLRPFHCPVCAKRFKMKHHLTEHMKTHTGLRPYGCPRCARTFMWRDSFMRHRSHCEGRGGEASSSPRLHLAAGEGGGGGGHSGVAAAGSSRSSSGNMGGVVSQSPGQGPGGFGGLGPGLGPGPGREDDGCDVSVT
ncbi:zinc finger and BTB domain-containing protein 22b [Brachionichthys hirsutus]|uniref:zinc finger and BTB domain-containing protein 22b n=1 Tax=Brachionichthys hirsutus TaxID=412623 RepID=UPI003605348D